MKRKHFFGALLASGAAMKGIAMDNASSNATSAAYHSIKIPPYLKAGDLVGITSPAGFITMEDIQPALQRLEAWGFRYRIGDTIGKKDHTYGGTDEERKTDLQQMMDDREIKAILCARGGYGLVRIIDDLSFRQFKKHPKWIIGFSDITVMHSHLHNEVHVASIHSKMTNSFPSDWNLAEQIQRDSIEAIGSALLGKPMEYIVPPNLANQFGKTEGQLVGGNLRTLETLSASASDIHTKNKILFVEDTGEYLYSIDRMFWNLKRSGKLDKLAGLLVGGFNVKKEDAGEEFGRTIEEIVMEKVPKGKYPVAFNFPVGHQRNNFPLKCGVTHHLEVNEQGCTLRDHSF